MALRKTLTIPGYELDWSFAAYQYNDADRYTGTYYDGTAYSNIQAIYGKRFLCLKQALVATGYTVLWSSVTTHMAQGDLWTNAPDIERGQGHWILLLAPDGVSLLLLQKDTSSLSTRTGHAWADFSGSYSTSSATPNTPPTLGAPVTISDTGTSSIFNGLDPWSTPTGAYQACRGTRGDEITSRVFTMHKAGGSNGKIWFILNFEWIVTDLTVAQWHRNVAFFCANNGVTKTIINRFSASDATQKPRVTVSTGDVVRICNLAPSDLGYVYAAGIKAGYLDSKIRMLPMYLFGPYSAPQFWGYIPDSFFGSTYSESDDPVGYKVISGSWIKHGDWCLPVFSPGAYMTKIADVDGASMALLSLGDIANDTQSPMFAGLLTATTQSNSAIRLDWSAATDNVSMDESLVYEIHFSTSPGAAFEVKGEAVGTVTYDVTNLAPGTTYYFRVRCRDEAGNTDLNAVEVSATTTGYIDQVVPTATLISPPEAQPIGPHTTHVIDVEDEHLLRRVWITVSYPSSATSPREIIYDGDEFEPVQFGNCSRVTLVEGRKFRYYITRTTGWKSKPRITVRAIDAGGNEIELLS